jgi:MFS family permease
MQKQRLWVTVWAIGFTQIFAWGATYYLLTILAEPIAADNGWPKTWVVGGLSLSLVVAGLISPVVGETIHRYGGRAVLAASSAILAMGLVALSASSNILLYLVSWTILGFGMGAGLYDATFATLGRAYGSDARSAITALTLIAGFSSTICWPLSAFLLEYWGWRGVCLFYAALHFGLSLPAHLLLVPAKEGAPALLRSEPSARATIDLRLYLLAVVMTFIAIISAIMSVFLVAMLESGGMGRTASIGVAASLGPSQVTFRFVEMLFGRHYHPIWTLVGASGLIATGLGLLALSWQGPAVIIYGGGIGIAWVARGTVPLALFGSRDYAVLMGWLAVPSLIAQALAPCFGAFLMDTYGAGTTVMILLLAALLTLGTAIWLKTLSFTA